MLPEMFAKQLPLSVSINLSRRKFPQHNSVLVQSGIVFVSEGVFPWSTLKMISYRTF